MNKNLINFFTFFVSSVPVTLVTGPFISDALVSLSSFFFVIIIFKKKLYYLFNNFFFKSFFLFWILLIFSSILSYEKIISLKVSVFYIRFGIFSLLIFYLLRNSDNSKKYFLYSFLITLIIVIADTYLQFFTGENILGFKSSEEGTRLSSFFKNELIVGSYIARLFPLVIALIFINEIKYSKYIIFILFILVDTIVFLSGERTAFGIVMIFNFLYIFLIKEHRFLRLFALILSTAIIFFSINFNESINKRMIDQTYQELFDVNNKNKNNNNLIINFINNKIGIVVFTEQHQQHISTALKIFMDNKIFGAGPKMFRYICSDPKYNSGKWSCTTHPHNTHIQILAEVGLLGYSFVIIILLYLIKVFIFNFFGIFFKLKTNSNYQLVLFFSFFGTLFPFIPSGNFFNNWLSIVYYLPVGFYLHSVLKK